VSGIHVESLYPHICNSNCRSHVALPLNDKQFASATLLGFFLEYNLPFFCCIGAGYSANTKALVSQGSIVSAMAEIVAVIGSVGALVNIIDAATKVISTIHKLQTQWKDAHFAVLSLASQLSAFRAALRRIHEWLDTEVPAAHHQLVMDLDETISFCKLLIAKIEVLSDEWETLLKEPKAIAARWKVTVGNKGLDNVLVLVERQTSALTLLLTACNWYVSRKIHSQLELISNSKSIAGQKRLLERPRTRRILQRAKADSASLLVHQDTSSRKSRLTDNLSKMSKVFDFDPAVFSSGVYHRVFRGSLMSSLRQQHPRVLGSPTKQSMHESFNPDSNRPGSTGGLSSITAAFIETNNVAVDAGATSMMSSNFPPDYNSIYPHDGHDSLNQTSGTASTIIPEPMFHSESPATWSRPHANSLALVQLCEARMLEECDTFAASYVKRLAELDAEHALTYFDDQAGQITRRISQAHIIWRDPTFQQLLLGGPSGPIIGGPRMTLCRL
jgi:hypothetical protein